MDIFFMFGMSFIVFGLTMFFFGEFIINQFFSNGYKYDRHFACWVIGMMSTIYYITVPLVVLAVLWIYTGTRLLEWRKKWK